MEEAGHTVSDRSRRDAQLTSFAQLATSFLGVDGARVQVHDGRVEAAGVAGPDGAPPVWREELASVTCSAAQALGTVRVDDAAGVVVRAYLGVPLRAADGSALGTLCVFSATPRRWTDEDLARVEQLTGPFAAELELGLLRTDFEAQRVRFQLAVDAAQIGAFDWDLVTGDLHWDDRLLELFGLTRAEFGATINAFNDALHPDDLPRVTAALDHAIATCGEYVAEYRVLLRNGAVRWLAARGRALGDEQGRTVRLLGAAYDVTAAAEGEARVARVLEAMPTAYFHLDRDWRFSHVNPEAEKLLARPRTELLGGVVWDLFPESVDSDFERSYRRAVGTGEPVAFDAYYPFPLDAWYEVRAWPDPDGLSVFFHDVTARHEAQQVLDAAARRAAFLADVTTTLSETLDRQEAVGSLASLVAHELGDWCLVSVVERPAHAEARHPERPGEWRSRVRDVGWWHADAARRPDLDTYAASRIESLSDASFLARALREERPVVVQDDAGGRISALLEPGPAREAFLRLRPGSVAVIPLPGRERVVGLLTVFRAPERGGFEDEDLRLLDDLAERAGLALDNVRLYAEQRELAEGLQRSLLTDPPQPAGTRMAVRYLPAAAAAQVGGDWYDAFVLEGTDPHLVIGDVVGHDTDAAAAMGQLRGLLRGVAVQGEASPAGLLRAVDRAIEVLDLGTMASAVVARVERRPDGGRDLVWSNAGHPPPVAVTGGGARLLEEAERGTWLGLDAEVARTEARTTLPPGSTVLLYTDGLVERRGEAIDVGLERLRACVERLTAAGPDLDTLLDRLLAELVPERGEDDVAVVAVRLDGP
ncbi:SpoIIE family protein phosphatase [Nocardioides sp. GY 10127]|uniref:SpoIIE family protein phosphatase n=1 Tax=Nocardioides sp. GY 10127 TaxID=2569762 RepID=UPI0010A761EB|nr:SpoIIE family protein phosphatase [Nocardioides sp. GY 10127]TIC81694.1 GAF domain-containing protein [Nocardioides sp. GY 10127]